MKVFLCAHTVILLLVCFHTQVRVIRGSEELYQPSTSPLGSEELYQPSTIPRGNEKHKEFRLLHHLLEHAVELENNRTISLRARRGTETWNNRMKALITGLVGVINVEGIPVGKFVSVLIGFFWPSSAVDIWDLVKEQVECMIDQKILAAEMAQLKNSINGLHRTMVQYVEAKPNEKGSLMAAITAICNDLHIRLVQSENAQHLIPLTVTLSYMHLTSLKERLMHGKEIYQEDNTEVWRNDLEGGIEMYKKDFERIYAKWRDWKRDSIVVTLGQRISPTTLPPFFFYIFTGEVYDKVTGEKRNFETWKTTFKSNPTYFKEICETVKTMQWNRANGAMLQVLVPTFFLGNFIPGSEDNPSRPNPDMLTASFGPFSYTILDGYSDSTRTVYYPSSDNQGTNPVSQVNVREWNSIDGLQFYYTDSWGRFVGNARGGLLHELEAKGRLVHNVKFSFNNGGMVDIEIIFSDGQSSGRLGNRGHWVVTRAEAGGVDTFGLINVKMNGNSGITQIEWFYQHFTCRPSEIKLNTKKLK